MNTPTHTVYSVVGSLQNLSLSHSKPGLQTRKMLQASKLLHIQVKPHSLILGCKQSLTHLLLIFCPGTITFLDFTCGSKAGEMSICNCTAT